MSSNEDRKEKLSFLLLSATDSTTAVTATREHDGFHWFVFTFKHICYNFWFILNEIMTVGKKIW